MASATDLQQILQRLDQIQATNANLVSQNQDLNGRLTKATTDLAETQSSLQATRQAAMILEAQTKARTDTLETLLTKTRGLDGDHNRKSLVDNKGLSIPKVFDSDQKKFHSWAFKFINWVNGVYAFGREVMLWAGQQDETAITKTTLTDQFSIEHTESELRAFDDQLYTALADKVDGEALHITENTANQSGCDVWRKLMKRFDPQTNSRKRSLMSKILNPGTAKLEQLSDKIEQWETDVLQFEQRSGKPVDDEFKAGILQEMCPTDLRDHLVLNASRFNNATAIRHEIFAYLENKMPVDRSKGTPMELGGFSKQKCPHCKKSNVKHKPHECYSNPSNRSSGWQDKGGKSKGKGKGGKSSSKGDKGGKSKGKGKSGKSTGKGVCFNCGKSGHHANQCWSKQQHWFDGSEQQEWDPNQWWFGGWETHEEPEKEQANLDHLCWMEREEDESLDGNCQYSCESVWRPKAYSWWNWTGGARSGRDSGACGGRNRDRGRWQYAWGSGKGSWQNRFTHKYTKREFSEINQNWSPTCYQWDHETGKNKCVKFEEMPPITVDSGASDSAIPNTVCKDYKTHPSKASIEGHRWKTPNGGFITSEGDKRVHFVLDDGTTCGAKFMTGDMSACLLAVSALADKGWDVLFSNKRGNWIYKPETKRAIPMYRVGGTYKLKAWAYPAHSAHVRKVEEELAWYEKPWQETEPKRWKPKSTPEVDDEGFQWHPAGK